MIKERSNIVRQRRIVVNNELITVEGTYMKFEVISSVPVHSEFTDKFPRLRKQRKAIPSVRRRTISS